MDPFRKVTTNCDILVSIFKYLNLKDQLKVAKICAEFEITLRELIWPVKCQTIKIIEPFEMTILVKCYKPNCEVSLDSENFQTFLNLCSNNVKILKLNCIQTAVKQIPFDFVNLTAIEFWGSQIDNRILKSIAKNSLKLTKIHINYCENHRNGPLVFGSDIDIDILNEMKMLKDFELINSSNTEVDFQYVNNFLKMSNVKVFSLYGDIQFKSYDNEVNENDHIVDTYSIENLSIGRFCDECSWKQFTSVNYLMHFKNLMELSIYLDPCTNLSIDDNLLETLVNTCNILNGLKLERCKLFIKKFPKFEKLSNLSFIWCWGLTGSNLQDIFIECQIQSLTIINTFCSGNIYELSYSSNTLETLIVETSLQADITPAFINPLNSFKNVHTVSWLQTAPRKYLSNISIFENISNIYPNVQELTLSDHYISVTELRGLNFLNILELNYLPIMSWSYIRQLLELTQLTSLTINLLLPLVWLIPNIGVIEDAHHNLTKTLEYLKIPFYLINLNVNFWLFFLQNNKNLKIIASAKRSENFDTFLNVYLKNLLADKFFSDRYKYINVCDYIIDCQDLKTNFTETLSKFQFLENVEGEYYIILQNPK
ncbi:uncharacterized protein ACRADG_002928 [Cochliomyia hominivorax]